MYIKTESKELKRLGEIYKEEVKETHYKKAKGVIITPKMVFVKYKTANRDGATEKETAVVISQKDLVRIEIYE